MKSKELKAARMLLMLDMSEAAEEIGTVTRHTWRTWEAGKYRVPNYVETQMHELLAERLKRIEDCDRKVNNGEWLQLPFYESFDQYRAEHPAGSVMTWRISQSIAARYFAEGVADLI